MIILVAIMPNKLNRPHLQYLLQLLEKDHQIIRLSSEQILLHPIEKWPSCDVLLSFYHSKLPFYKVHQYASKFMPRLINDFLMQYALLDRRVVKAILEKLSIPTPKGFIVNRGYNTVSDDVFKIIKTRFNLNVTFSNIKENELIETETYIEYNSMRIYKPFIEKPANAEDHNIFVYQKESVRKLFRKKGNVSSQIDYSIKSIRRNGSFIYEEFIEPENGVDIKVYALGNDFVYAESRKAPTIDGIVERDEFGKEKREIVTLTESEAESARRIGVAFKQRVCGLDIIRKERCFYVIDINGWSFVKTTKDYYDKCAEMINKEVNNAKVTENKRIVKMIRVYRHADRTPKQKIKSRCNKYNAKSALDSGLATVGPLKEKNTIDILHGANSIENVRESSEDDNMRECKAEIDSISKKTLENSIKNNPSEIFQKFMLRNEKNVNFSAILPLEKGQEKSKSELADLKSTKKSATNREIVFKENFADELRKFLSQNYDIEKNEEITEIFSTLQEKDPSKNNSDILYDIKTHTEKETEMKLQIKILPYHNEIILKWGGILTHSGVFQSKELGENLRYFLAENHPHILKQIKVFSSTENRVLKSSELFSQGLTLQKDVEIIQDKELLGDTFQANDLIEESRRVLEKEFENFVTQDQTDFLINRLRDVDFEDFGDESSEFMGLSNAISKFCRRFEDVAIETKNHKINNDNGGKVSSVKEKAKLHDKIIRIVQDFSSKRITSKEVKNESPSLEHGISANNISSKLVSDTITKDKIPTNNISIETVSDSVLKEKITTNNITVDPMSDTILKAKTTANNIFIKPVSDTVLKEKTTASNISIKPVSDTVLKEKITPNNIIIDRMSDIILKEETTASNISIKPVSDTVLKDITTPNNISMKSVSDTSLKDIGIESFEIQNKIKENIDSQCLIINNNISKFKKTEDFKHSNSLDESNSLFRPSNEVPYDSQIIATPIISQIDLFKRSVNIFTDVDNNSYINRMKPSRKINKAKSFKDSLNLNLVGNFPLDFEYNKTYQQVIDKRFLNRNVFLRNIFNDDMLIKYNTKKFRKVQNKSFFDSKNISKYSDDYKIKSKDDFYIYVSNYVSKSLNIDDSCFKKNNTEKSINKLECEKGFEETNLIDCFCKKLNIHKNHTNNKDPLKTIKYNILNHYSNKFDVSCAFSKICKESSAFESSEIKNNEKILNDVENCLQNTYNKYFNTTTLFSTLQTPKTNAALKFNEVIGENSLKIELKMNKEKNKIIKTNNPSIKFDLEPNMPEILSTNVYDRSTITINQENSFNNSKPNKSSKQKELYNIKARYTQVIAKIKKYNKITYTAISEIYNNLKYDITHNNEIIQKIFMNHDILYSVLKNLYGFIIENEYGKTFFQKIKISKAMASNLLYRLVEDMFCGKTSLVIYFTKESRIYTLFYIFVFLSGKPFKIKEFDYGSFISIEIYEDNTIKIFYNRGADFDKNIYGSSDLRHRVSLRDDEFLFETTKDEFLRKVEELKNHE